MLPINKSWIYPGKPISHSVSPRHLYYASITTTASTDILFRSSATATAAGILPAEEAFSGFSIPLYSRLRVYYDHCRTKNIRSIGLARPQITWKCHYGETGTGSAKHVTMRQCISAQHGCGRHADARSCLLVPTSQYFSISSVTPVSYLAILGASAH